MTVTTEKGGGLAKCKNHETKGRKPIEGGNWCKGACVLQGGSLEKSVARFTTTNDVGTILGTPPKREKSWGSGVCKMGVGIPYQIRGRESRNLRF